MSQPSVFESVLQFYEYLPEGERIIVDVLRQIIKEHLPADCKEKFSYNVPFFYGKRGIAIIWPSSIPRGGIKSGVLLGFWQGNKLKDSQNYLQKGNNKKVFYRIYYSVDEIEEEKIVHLLQEAIELDQR